MQIKYIIFLLILMVTPAYCWSQSNNADKTSQNILEAEKCMNEGRYTDALKKLQDAETTKDLPSGTLFDIYRNKAICHKHLGEYALASQEYDVTLEYADGIIEQDNISYNKACLLIEMGKLDDASTLLNTITHPYYADWVVTRKSEILCRQGKVDEALNLISKTIDTLSVEKDSYPYLLQNHAYLLQSIKGKESQAVAEMQTLLTLIPQNTLNYQILKGNLAVTEAIIGKYGEALKHIDEAILWTKSVDEKNLSDHIILLRKKAEILMMMNRTNDAENAYREYYSEEKKYAVKNFVSMTEQNRLDFWKLLKQNVNKIFALESQCPDFLLDVAIFRREVALLGSAEKKEITRRLSLTGNDVRKALGIGEVAIDFICYTKNDTARYGALVVPSLKSGSPVRFVPICTESELTERKVGHKTLAEAVCSISDYDKDKIYNDSTLATFIWQPLISYVKGKDVYFAPDGIFQMLAIEYLPTKDTLTSRLHRMSSISRLTERNAKKAESPDKTLMVGGLNYNGKTESSASSTPNHDAATYLHKALSKTDCFTPLKHSAEEIRNIEKILTKADSSFCLTEEQMKSKLSTYSRVHLSTHGYALQVDVQPLPTFLQDSITEDRSLLACGIALTGANVAYKDKNLEDGILSAREICDMNLKGVDLVVLAACQTAQGHVSDEGPAGIVRGLKKAGVKTIIATLWPIDDASTSMFVASFYRYLAKNNKHTAFALAQKELRSYECQKKINGGGWPSSWQKGNSTTKTVTRKPYKDPRYWAPFIMIDDY